MRVIERTDLPMAVEGDGVEFRTDRAGDHNIAWVRLPKGADLRPALVGLQGNLCPCPHWGYMIAGRLLMHTEGGSQTYQAGQAFYWAPGHAPEAIEDCEFIDISPTDQFEDVMRHLQPDGPA